MDYSTQRKKSMTVFAGVAAIFMVLSVVSINFLAQQFKGKQANTSCKQCSGNKGQCRPEAAITTEC